MIFSSCAMPEAENIENAPSRTTMVLPENGSPPTSSQAEPHETIEADPSTLLPFIDAQGKYGYMDNQGNVIIKPMFDVADRFSEGVAVAAKVGKEGYKAGYIDGMGDIIIPMEYDYAFPFSDGIATAVIEKPEGNTTVYLDSDGKELLKVDYYMANPFHEGMALVLVNNLFGVIDRNGQYIKQPQYKDVGGLYDGLIMIYNYNEQGETIGLHYETLEGMTIEPKE